MVNISYFLDQAQVVSFSVHTLSGSLVEGALEISSIVGQNELTIDTHTWKNGIYLVQITLPNESFRKRLIVNN